MSREVADKSEQAESAERPPSPMPNPVSVVKLSHERDVSVRSLRLFEDRNCLVIF